MPANVDGFLCQVDGMIVEQSSLFEEATLEAPTRHLHVSSQGPRVFHKPAPMALPFATLGAYVSYDSN